jgi:hypothetical protein
MTTQNTDSHTQATAGGKEGALQGPWTPEIVKEYIKEAIETAKLLTGDRPSGYRNYWPEVVRKSPFEIDIKEYRGKYDDKKMKFYAENDAIDRFDKVQGWMSHLHQEEIRLLWSKALGAPNTWIARKLGYHRNSVMPKYRRAIRKLLREINQ